MTSVDGARHIRVDAEHAGIRILIPVLGLGGLALGFIAGQFILNSIDESISGGCLGIPLAFVFAVLFVQIGERFIKPRWTSGRAIKLTDDQLLVQDHRNRKSQELIYTANGSLDAVAWYFEVANRHNRVPKGWYCVSVHLRQNDQEIIIYTFETPDNVQEIPGWKNHFSRLVPQKKAVLNAGQAGFQDSRQNILHKRLLKLEDQRWQDGAEVAREDFVAILEFLNEVAEFQPVL